MKYIGLFDEKEDIVTKEKLETKQDKITGAATTITDDNLTASHALVSDANGKVAVSDVTSTELGYLDGVTSNIQTQFDGKQPTITVNGIIKGDGAGNLSAQDTVAAELVDLPTVPTKVSELTNDSGYITAAQAPVQSVNNKTGAVSLTASDVSAIPSTLTGTAGQVLTKTADGQEWKDAAIDDETVLLKSVSAAMPVVANWNVITYGGGKFIALAANSDIGAYSTDGCNWTQMTLPVSSNWGGIVYGADKFVATGDNRVVIYSADGISWTQTALSSNAPTGTYDIGYLDNDGFYAIGDYSNYRNCFFSADGVTWPDQAFYSSRMYFSPGIARSKDKLVVVFGTYSIEFYKRTYHISSPSINITLPISSPQTVTYGDNKFVAIGKMNEASTQTAYSIDALNWDSSTMPVSAKWYDSCYGNGMFVAVATESSIAAYSTDGVNWNQTTLPESANWRSIAHDGYKFVAVASNSNVVAVSFDGIHWGTAADILQYPDGVDITDNISDILGIPTLKDDTFICMVTRTGTDSFTCDKKYNEILDAYASGKACIATLQNNGNEWKMYPYPYQNEIYYLSRIQRQYSSLVTNSLVVFMSVDNSSYSTITINSSNQITVTTIENAIIPKATKITLTVAGWDSTAKTQSVTVSGVSADATSQEIRVMPVDAALDSLYIGTGVQCIAQAANSLTFGCETVPTEAIEVYVVMQGVSYSA